MTNAEKYKEVFGMPVDPSNCPTLSCKDCPVGDVDQYGDVSCMSSLTYEWWYKEYKGVNNG